jgi:flagellar protein FliS
MAIAPPDRYLESKVLAAPPHRLHLMLIEGAIRNGRQAEVALRRGDQLASAAPLVRLIDIVGEMLVGVRDQRTGVNKNLTELYWYLFRRVSEAKIHSDATILAEVLRLLEYERETWALACAKLGAESAASVQARAPECRTTSEPATGLSLEA